MINPIKQSFIATAAGLEQNKNERKVENERIKNERTSEAKTGSEAVAETGDKARIEAIAEQIKNGSYQLDLKATARAIVEELF